MLDEFRPPVSPRSAQPRHARALETERLILRRPTLADAAAIALLANDARIARMTRRLPHPYRLDHATAFIAAQAVGDSESVWLIEDLDQTVGMIGIDRHDPDVPELGYWLGVSHWGRGYATEAARAVIAHTFADGKVSQIAAQARVSNPASRNVLEKCGFTWSGVKLLRVAALGYATPADSFRLTRETWRAASA